MCAVVWGAPRQEGQRECEGERKGREELRHGAGTVPQVPHRQGSGMGGTGKDVCCGVGCQTAGGAKSVRAPADPLQIGVKGRTEPGSQLGKGGAVGTGKGQLLLSYGRVRLLEDAVGWARGQCLCHCGGVEGLDGGFVGVGWEGVVSEVRGDSGEELGLEGVLHRAGTGGGRDNLVAGMGGDEATGKELG